MSDRMTRPAYDPRIGTRHRRRTHVWVVAPLPRHEVVVLYVWIALAVGAVVQIFQAVVGR
jgi:hypothetical protein